MKFVLLTGLLRGQEDNVSFKAGNKRRALNESHLRSRLPEKPQLRAEAEVADTPFRQIQLSRFLFIPRAHHRK